MLFIPCCLIVLPQLKRFKAESNFEKGLIWCWSAFVASLNEFHPASGSHWTESLCVHWTVSLTMFTVPAAIWVYGWNDRASDTSKQFWRRERESSCLWTLDDSLGRICSSPAVLIAPETAVITQTNMQSRLRLFTLGLWRITLTYNIIKHQNWWKCELALSVLHQQQDGAWLSPALGV